MITKGTAGEGRAVDDAVELGDERGREQIEDLLRRKGIVSDGCTHSGTVLGGNVGTRKREGPR